MSSGIQFTPRTNTGRSLTRRVNAVPASSAPVSSATSRKPIRRSQRSSSPSPLSSSLSASATVTVSGYRGWPPYPRGHHSAGSRTGSVRTTASPGGAHGGVHARHPRGHRDRPGPRRPGPAPRAPRRPSAAAPSCRTTGRTCASRAVRQYRSSTGCQMPAVTRSGPQSQPKLQAILRSAAYGRLYGLGHGPPWAKRSAASCSAEPRSTTSSPRPPASSSVTGKEWTRCMFAVVPSRVPFSSIRARVSRPWQTRSTCSSPSGASQSKAVR